MPNNPTHRFNHTTLNGSSEAYPTKFLPLPKTLQVSSGSISLVNDAVLNIDANLDFSPDVVLDLAQVLNFGECLDAGRFGSFLLQPKAFDKIIAKTYLHRVPDLHLALSNCLALLQEGGMLVLSVPLDLSYAAWLDSDTRRVFSPNSWQLIVNDWWLYGWTESRFEMISSDFEVSNDFNAGAGNGYGHRWLAEHNNDWQMALRAPRVVDYQHVVLRKIALTAEEKKMQPHSRFMD